MINKELFKEIINTYKGYKDFQELKMHLENDINLAFWAHNFTDKKFNSNIKLSNKLFDYALRVAKDFRDYKDYAVYISKDSGLANKELAKEACKIAITKITTLRDLRNFADLLAKKSDSFYDQDMSKSIYKEVLSKSFSAYDFYCTAESLCNVELLNDKKWAKEVYELAIESAKSGDELTYIADSIAEEDNLGDEKWASEIYSKAE